jgi:hypothetical protein
MALAGRQVVHSPTAKDRNRLSAKEKSGFCPWVASPEENYCSYIYGVVKLLKKMHI